MIPTGHIAVSLLLLGAACLQAQDDPPPPTFHVYANLIQVPVLVLSDSHKPLPPIAPERFTLTLNAGRPFRPTHVRPEADDPIYLSILIDGRATDRSLLPHLPEALAAVASISLHPQDRLSLYTVQCKLIRYAEDASPEEPRLKAAFARAVLPPLKAPCPGRAHLWDAMGYIAQHTPGSPARPVLLVLTDGNDDGSNLRWQQLKEVADSRSVAIFALNPSLLYGARPDARENILSAICELTGGMVLHAEPQRLADALARFVTTLRGRYIVSFPRPDTLEHGPPVELRIFIANQHAFIRSTGIEVPLPDQSVLADPNTLRNDPSHAPQIGKRRPLLPPP